MKSSDMSSISCSGQESMCGMLSDFDEKDGRVYAMECCDNSNEQQEKEEKKTETVSLQSGSSKSFQSSSSSQCVKSIKIVSM